MDLQFVDKLAEFGEYENAKRRRGRPKKNYSEKKFGSLIEEKSSTPLRLQKSILSQFATFDAFTIEYITPVHTTDVTEKVHTIVNALRDIINKKARSFPCLELSGVRFITPRNYGCGNSLVDIRIVCTSFEGALFIFAHLAEFLYSDGKGYTGTAYHLYGVEKNLTTQRRAGSFDMETGGRWRSFFSDVSGDWWLTPAVNYSRSMLAPDFARVAAAAFRHFRPSHLSLFDLAIIKGAIGYCERLRPDGTVIFNEPRNVYKGFRGVQPFGVFYNMKQRRVEIHRAGFPWYKFGV